MQRLILCIGLVFSLLLLTIIGWWATEGTLHFQTRSIVGEAIEKYRSEEPPGLFWTVICFCLVISIAGLVFTAIGLAKKRSEKNK
jgi:hypothetical protein